MIKKLNQNAGFSIYELIVVLAILSALLPFIYSIISDVIQRKEAYQYADFTKTYASKFIDEIRNNYSDYYESAINNPEKPIVIKFSDIKNNLPQSLNWGILPCVSLKYNPTNKEMQAIMFYTNNGTKARSISRVLGIRSMNAFGIGSGYYDEKGVVNGISGAWTLNKENSYINTEHLKLCDTQEVTQNGLVINLNMLDNFSQAQSNGNGTYLSRVKDKNTNLGDEDNANSMQTDLLMQNGENHYGIFSIGHEKSTSNDDQIYVGTANAVNFDKVYKNKYNKNNDALFSKNSSALSVVGGNLVTSRGFIPAMSANVFSPCSKELVGTIVKSKPTDFDEDYNISAPYLICSFTQLQCNGSNYCFIPPNNSYRFTFSAENKRTTFTCPKNMYIDTTLPIDTSPINYNDADKIPELKSVSTCFDPTNSNTRTSDIIGACVKIPVSVNYSYTGDKVVGNDSLYEYHLYSGITTVNQVNRYYKLVPNQTGTRYGLICECDGSTVVGGWDTKLTAGYITGVSCSFSPVRRQNHGI